MTEAAEAIEGGYVVVSLTEVGQLRKRNPTERRIMEQIAFDFDQRAIDLAVAKIQMATKYIGELGGFMPGDPMGLVALRQHVSELSDGLAILSRLADALQQIQDKQAARGKTR